MERFFDGTDQENSKETRKKEWRKEKEEIVTYNQIPLTYMHGSIVSLPSFLPSIHPYIHMYIYIYIYIYIYRYI
jgi:hypothetical protein